MPAELVFDQGLGDLFVIRVAGNIVAPSQVGSVEFAASRFGTRLVVVLGHSQCGAILATIDELTEDSDSPSRNISAIVDRVKPSVETLLDTELRNDPERLVREAVRALQDDRTGAGTAGRRLRRTVADRLSCRFVYAFWLLRGSTALGDSDIAN